VRQTALKILVCAEVMSQMAIGKEMTGDPLPEAVKARVAWRANYRLRRFRRAQT
jgi:alpha-glucuronidase